jgi:CD109 antigen
MGEAVTFSIWSSILFVQDTIIGLQALAKLAERVSSSSVDISVSFSYPGGSPTYFRINRSNSMILQKQEVCT